MNFSRRRSARPLAPGTLALAGAAALLASGGCSIEAPEAPGPGLGTSASASEPAPRQSPASEAAPRELTVNVSGDLLWHDDLWASARIDAGTTDETSDETAMDFGPQLESVRDYLSSADLAVCHSEVPFAADGGPYGSYPMFAAPPQIADTLADVGFDVCTTASNHTLDAGWSGLVRTLDVHEEAGIGTVGSYRSAQEAGQPFLHTTEEGITVGIVSQTFSLNGIPLPAGKDWSVAMLDADRAIAQARHAREAGADVVLVHLHAGTEYQTEPNAEQREFVERVTSSGEIDLVYGQHAHWVQPVDIVNDTWVAYGAGNLMAHHELGKPGTYEGAIFQFTFTERPRGDFEVTGAEYAPTLITPQSGNDPARLWLIPAERDRHPELADQMDAAAQRTRNAIYRYGVEGLTEVGR